MSDHHANESQRFKNKVLSYHSMTGDTKRFPEGRANNPVRDAKARFGMQEVEALALEAQTLRQVKEIAEKFGDDGTVARNIEDYLESQRGSQS
jgi:hypothetical protein